MRITRRTWILTAVVFVALAVRLVGIDRGLPYVYEEAVPLKTAWTMAGWGEAAFDPNPHFFHYPSLAFYTQLAGLAVVNAGMRVTGTQARDVRIRYYTDPTPFYLNGRFINVLFALLTIVAVASLARGSGDAGVGAAAAVLLALNVFHISRSQMIEVDVPLTALVTLALVALAGLATSPSRRAYVLAGLALGLATSTKYTGALLMVPLVTAHMLARRSMRAHAGWGRMALALAVAAAAFVVTSPYVVLDFSTFRADLALERAHMRLGHFGGDDEAALVFYFKRLGQTLLGWPALALAAIGMAAALVSRGRAWAVVVASFVFAYVAAISTWAVTADRYLLPVIPALLAFAAWGASAGGKRLAHAPRARTAILAVAVAAMAAPGLPRWREHRARAGLDSRTIALEWIVTNVEPGSLVVAEAYGPPLFGPLQFWAVDADIRTDVYRRRAPDGFRGLLPIPLFQAEPEETAPYYDTRLYRDADIFVTTGAVRGRYEADPDRFPAQAAFYDSLDTDFELIYAVDARGTGPRIFVHRNRRHDAPFAARAVGACPRLVGPNLPPRWRAWFYYRMGLNYEAFGHLRRALETYERGWPDAVTDSETYRQTAYGIVRSLRLLGRQEEIPARIAYIAAQAPRGADREFIDALGGAISR